MPTLSPKSRPANEDCSLAPAFFGPHVCPLMSGSPSTPSWKEVYSSTKSRPGIPVKCNEVLELRRPGSIKGIEHSGSVIKEPTGSPNLNQVSACRGWRRKGETIEVPSPEKLAATLLKPSDSSSETRVQIIAPIQTKSVKICPPSMVHPFLGRHTVYGQLSFMSASSELKVSSHSLRTRWAQVPRPRPTPQFIVRPLGLNDAQQGRQSTLNRDKMPDVIPSGGKR